MDKRSVLSGTEVLCGGRKVIIHYEGIDDPNFCKVCKKKHNTYFNVPDDDWWGVVPNEMLGKCICWTCYANYRKIKKLPELKYEDYEIK